MRRRRGKYQDRKELEEKKKKLQRIMQMMMVISDDKGNQPLRPRLRRESILASRPTKTNKHEIFWPHVNAETELLASRLCQTVDLDIQTQTMTKSLVWSRNFNISGEQEGGEEEQEEEEEEEEEAIDDDDDDLGRWK